MMRRTFHFLTVASSFVALACAVTQGSALAGTKSAKKRASGGSAQNAAVAQLVAQAKALMAQGARLQAIELLDQAAAASRSRAEGRELAAKRQLFAEQFLTAEAFQGFQEARGLEQLERWDECLRVLDSIPEKDRGNLLVLRLRVECQRSARQYGAAESTLKTILVLVPGDLQTVFALVDLDVTLKQPAQGLLLLDAAQPRESLEIERFVILKSRLLELAGRIDDAAVLLREDQETHLDHVNVLYELGMLYTRITGRDWPARKMLSLFVTRCQRMKEAELKSRKLDLVLPAAQSTLAALDKKLGV